EFAGPYTGFYLIENYKVDFGGKNLMYRWYVNDPVRFQKSIRVTIEHGHANNYDNDYTSTASSYQTEPHKLFPPLPSAEERLPLWPDDVKAALEKELKIGRALQRMVLGGRTRLTEEDKKLPPTLVADANKAFRALRSPDYIKAVDAEE